jgi:hypothetical protein
MTFTDYCMSNETPNVFQISSHSQLHEQILFCHQFKYLIFFHRLSTKNRDLFNLVN